MRFFLPVFLIVALVCLNAIFFQAIELRLLHWNFGWTFTRILLYALPVFLGLIVCFMVWRRTRKKARFVSIFIGLACLSLPFGLCFALNPIYEGDFSNESKHFHSKVYPKEFEQADLIMIGIPGCGFCLEATTKLKLLKQRNPNLRIKVLLCTTDSTQLEVFRKKLPQGIQVAMPYNHRDIFSLSNGKFPAFIFVNHRKGGYTFWSNNQFGLRALDAVESGK